MVEIINRQKKSPIRTEPFRVLLQRLLRRARRAGDGVTLVFAGDSSVRRLNREFRGKDKTTDVLSFPIHGRGEDDHPHLGDIIISVPRARAQAASLGHSLEAELAYLAIHGFVHLCGYEHEAGHEEEEIRALEAVRKDRIINLPKDVRGWNHG
ncbi:MAG: rRNA maturation RNase YbeY [Candidatus Aminicenantes bacterium]|nr:rRNA maturation RNase YbeY [Candidatus Aminicenantes bacterium]